MWDYWFFFFFLLICIFLIFPVMKIYWFSNKEQQVIFNFLKKKIYEMGRGTKEWHIQIIESSLKINSLAMRQSFELGPKINRGLGGWWGEKGKLEESDMLLLVFYLCSRLRFNTAAKWKKKKRSAVRGHRDKHWLALKFWKALDNFMAVNNICSPAGQANGRGN